MKRGVPGFGIFRIFSQWKGFVLGIALTLVFAVAGIALAATVSDTFTDTTKITSSTNLTVDTSNGQVKLAVTSSWACGSALLDSRDSKSYDTVLIGTQCWMVGSLNVGTMTAGVNSQGTDCPSAAAIEKYCYGNSEENCTTYGALYQWNQAMCGSTTAGATGICPTGWHVPTDGEFYTLESYLATGSCSSTRDNSHDCSPAGTSLKTGGASGFEALLSGYRATDGSFSDQTTGENLWSSLETSTNAWARSMGSQATVYRANYVKTLGLTVRCLKD